jgi:hypothetical protein
MPTLIDLSLSPDGFTLQDRCGGIGVARAKEYAFRFGNVDSDYTGSLGVYGIGMKRALFKLGRRFHIDSRTAVDGFTMDVDVDKWKADDDNWTFAMNEVEPAASAMDAGTLIRIDLLTPEALLRLKDNTLLKRLSDSIAVTYALFLQRYLSVTLNGVRIEPQPLPIGRSESLKPASIELEVDGVRVDLVAGLAAREEGEWPLDRAGWYVLCNGRVVVAADRTELTGWGIHGPKFVSKYRGFIGIAIFFARDTAKLPWTTTKRGLNLESEAYQRARSEMTALARPVLTFLNNMYPGEPASALEERRMADQLDQADVATVIAGPKANFQVTPRRRTKRSTVSVQFRADKSEVDRVRRRLGKPGSWAAGNAGRYAFEYFLRMECES